MKHHRKTPRRLALGSALLFALLACMTASERPLAAQPPPAYKITDLGPIAFDLGSLLTRYICINNNGLIGGNWLPVPGIMHAFLMVNGHHKDLGALPGYEDSRMLAMNDKGDVVGYCDKVGPQGFSQKSFIWTHGKMHAIDLPARYPNSIAVAINNDDEVLVRTPTDALLWKDGKTTELGVEGAVGMNAAGEVFGTGRYHHGGGPGYAYILRAHKPFDLGTLSGGWRSTASCINNAGDVVGYAGVHYRSRAFLWNKSQLVDLSSEANSSDSVATSINNKGQIVGFAGGPGVYGTDSRAYLWQDGVGYNLNSHIPSGSGWLLISADSINDRGDIVGFGHHNGEDRAFLIQPVK